jgi:hypothetical protein
LRESSDSIFRRRVWGEVGDVGVVVSMQYD